MSLPTPRGRMFFYSNLRISERKNFFRCPVPDVASILSRYRLPKSAVCISYLAQSLMMPISPPNRNNPQMSGEKAGDCGCKIKSLKGVVVHPYHAVILMMRPTGALLKDAHARHRLKTDTSLNENAI